MSKEVLIYLGDYAAGQDVLVSPAGAIDESAGSVDVSGGGLTVSGSVRVGGLKVVPGSYWAADESQSWFVEIEPNRPDRIAQQIADNGAAGRHTYEGLTSAEIGDHNRRLMFGQDDEAFPDPWTWSQIVD
jgi:hypothetical protein